MSRASPPKPAQMSIFSPEGFRAKMRQLCGAGGQSADLAKEPASTGNFFGSRHWSGQRLSSSRTSRVSSQQTKDVFSRQSSHRWTTWGMWGNGECWTEPRSGYPSDASMYSSSGLIGGPLAVFQRDSGWTILTIGTRLDSNYWKGVDKHGQRTVVLLRGATIENSLPRSARLPLDSLWDGPPEVPTASDTGNSETP